MNTTRILVMAAAALSASLAWAQTDTVMAPEEIFNENIIENTKVIYFGNESFTDSTAYRKHLNQFYQDQFRHAQDPRAPYFMLMSRNGQIGMGIGGDLKMIGMYDWAGSQSGTSFVPYNIPMTPDPANRNSLQMTPSRTAIYFTVFGNSTHFGNYMIYVHAKFNGPGNSFKLDRAYATVGDLTVGYAKSTFDDPTAQPSTIDTEGPNSEIDDSRVLIRYMHNIKDHFSMALSAENPSKSIPVSNNYKPTSNTVPDFAAFVQYAFGSQHIRLSGIVRTLGYRDLVSQSNHHDTGWGLNLTAKLRPVKPLTVMAAVNTGKGINSLVNDLSYGSTDLLGYADNAGKMYAPLSYGWYAALQMHYTPKIFSTLIFSHERILPKSGSVYGGDEYKYGLYGTANVFWNITTRLQLGAEYNMGKRCNINGDSRLGYRASLMAEFNF